MKITVLFLIYPNDIIPKFDHPVVVDLGRNLKYVATDLTAFVREMQPGEYTVGNRSLYTLQTLRSGLDFRLSREWSACD